jgi:putative heme iron utilization protein
VSTSGLRELLFAERQGVLATLSARRAGWPFASVAPYALTDEAEPLLLFSDLAEHTRNVRADPRASLLVQDSAALHDPQAGSRLTLLGTVEPFSAGDAAAAQARYLERHPQSADYFAMSDFRLYVLHVQEARFISGFGDMGWMNAQRFHKELAVSP